MAEVAGPTPPRATGAIGTPAECSIVVSTASRSLRRKLRPLAWLVLEEVALTAVEDGGRLVAHTSARQVADRVGVDPGTAAGALRVLRDRGLLRLEREKGRAGRFGLSVYVLGSIAGLTVVRPSAVERHCRRSHRWTRRTWPNQTWLRLVRKNRVRTRHMGRHRRRRSRTWPPEPAAQECGLPPAPAVAPVPADRPRRAALLAVPAMQNPGQGTLDLDGSVA